MLTVIVIILREREREKNKSRTVAESKWEQARPAEVVLKLLPWVFGDIISWFFQR